MQKKEDDHLGPDLIVDLAIAKESPGLYLTKKFGSSLSRIIFNQANFVILLTIVMAVICSHAQPNRKKTSEDNTSKTDKTSCLDKISINLVSNIHEETPSIIRENRGNNFGHEKQNNPIKNKNLKLQCNNE